MHVCLVVPGPGDHADHVAAAVRDHHAGAELVAVWAGDPHLRPAPPAGATWIDHALPDLDGLTWGRLLIALEPAAYALARGAAAVARRLDTSGAPHVVLHVGAAVLLGGLDALVAARGLVVAPRGDRAAPPDGLAPSAADIVAAGPWSTAAYGAAADAAAALRSIAAYAAGSPPGDDGGAAFATGITASGCAVATTDQVLAVGWPGTARVAAVLDVGSVVDDDPIRIRTAGAPARVRLSEAPELAAALHAQRGQWRGIERALALPGGIGIDATMRALVADDVDAWRRGERPLPPDPWDASTGSFVEWLETPWPAWGADVGRYWTRLRADRPDLVSAFADPARADRDAFVAWVRDSWRYEPRSPLLRVTARPMRPPWHDAGRAPHGVNLVGYHAFDNSLGDVVRRLRGALEAAGVGVAPVHYHRSGSPAIDPPPLGLTDELRYDTNVIVINADQLPDVDHDHGTELWPGRRSIGYWFWDVEYVPPHVVAAMRWLDEVWVATPFTAQALGAVADIPVRVVEIPVPEPVPGPATRADLGLPDGRFVFLVTFDHLSVTERKNPIGAIEAFRRAFPEPTPDGPMLVVKSLNAAQRWIEHERVRLAAAARPDIVVTDRHLDRGSQLALIARADCLVSLHRSEGLGLHLIEAMWLGTPTIATRYSGNVHVAGDDCALLVDATMTPVTRGEGYFPPEAVWADPDLDQAAAAMRRLVADPALCERLARAGRARTLQQPAPAAAGAAIASLLAPAPAAAITTPDTGGSAT